MSSRTASLLPTRGFTAVLLSAVMAAVLAVASVTAAEPQLPASLKLVPADAAFYSASLRLREQVEIVGRSNAWKALKNLPAVRDAWDQLEHRMDQPGTPAAAFLSAWENPMVQSYLATLGDMFSEEVFVLGDGAYGDFISFWQDLSNGTRIGTVVALLQDPEAAMEAGREEIQASTALAIAAESIEQLRIPTTIIGFRIRNTDRADEQLRAMAGLMQFLTLSVPQLQGRFQQRDIAGGKFYVLSLDAKMVPMAVWEEMESKLEDLETEAGQAKKIVEHLRQLTLVAAVGIRDNWLLVSTGPSTEWLASLGTGEVLADRAELEPLRQFADRKLTSVAYASEAFHRQVAGTPKDLEGLSELVDAILEEVDLSSAEKSEIQTDAQRIVGRFKEITPEPGAVLSFDFISEHGIESYTYNWSRGLRLDSSHRLGLLHHLGGNPLLAVVARGVDEEQEYEILTDLVATACKYIDRHLPKVLDADAREQYQKAKKLVVPLGKRADRVTRELLLPAMADGQAGIVLDAGLRVQRLHRDLPRFDEPMPLPALAFVLGVSDAVKLTEAGEKYVEIVNDFLAGLHEIAPDEVPQLKVPAPETTVDENGTIYTWALPKQCGVTKQIAPNVGVGKEVAVVSYSPKQTARLLASKPLEAGGVLQQDDQPAAIAGCLDIAGMLEAARPWIHLALAKSPSIPAGVVEQVDTVIDVLKSVRTVTLRSYFADDALVTHSLLEIRDLP